MRYSAQREHVIQSVGLSVNAALDSILIHVYRRLAEQLAHLFIRALVFAIPSTFGICDAMVRPIWAGWRCRRRSFGSEHKSREAKSSAHESPLISIVS